MRRRRDRKRGVRPVRAGCTPRLCETRATMQARPASVDGQVQDGKRAPVVVRGAPPRHPETQIGRAHV